MKKEKLKRFLNNKPAFQRIFKNTLDKDNEANKEKYPDGMNTSSKVNR